METGGGQLFILGWAQTGGGSNRFWGEKVVVVCANADGAEAKAPWSSCMTAFDSLNERIARVATT